MMPVVQEEEPAWPEVERRSETLSACVRQSLEGYFRELGGHPARDVYELVLSEVERPLLEVVMKVARGNLSRAALMLGLNRGTLRKKLVKYGLDY